MKTPVDLESVPTDELLRLTERNAFERGLVVASAVLSPALTLAALVWILWFRDDIWPVKLGLCAYAAVFITFAIVWVLYALAHLRGRVMLKELDRRFDRGSIGARAKREEARIRPGEWVVLFEAQVFWGGGRLFWGRIHLDNAGGADVRTVSGSPPYGSLKPRWMHLDPYEYRLGEDDLDRLLDLAERARTAEEVVPNNKVGVMDGFQATMAVVWGAGEETLKVSAYNGCLTPEQMADERLRMLFHVAGLLTGADWVFEPYSYFAEEQEAGEPKAEESEAEGISNNQGL